MLSGKTDKATLSHHRIQIMEKLAPVAAECQADFLVLSKADF